MDLDDRRFTMFCVVDEAVPWTTTNPVTDHTQRVTDRPARDPRLRS